MMERADAGKGEAGGGIQVGRSIGGKRQSERTSTSTTSGVTIRSRINCAIRSPTLTAESRISRSSLHEKGRALSETRGLVRHWHVCNKKLYASDFRKASSIPPRDDQLCARASSLPFTIHPRFSTPCHRPLRAGKQHSRVRRDRFRFANVSYRLRDSEEMTVIGISRLRSP
jgi:hypothetical protein